MTERLPKISVVIPTHNRPDRLKKALQTVLEQTFDDFEIIVVDDGLKVRAENVIKEFSDERLRYIKHDTNKGGGAARNTGIDNARAELVAFLDDDDEWYPEKLEKQYDIMKKYWNEIGFVFCKIKLDYEGRGLITEQRLKQIGIYDLHSDFLAHRLRALTSSLLIKKEALDYSHGFDVKFQSCQEWDMMIRISEKYKGYGMNEILVKMNYLQGDHIGGNLDRRIQGRRMLIEKHFDELVKTPDALAAHYFQLGLFYRDNEMIAQARRSYLKAIKFDAKKILYWKHFCVLLFGNNLYKKLQKR